MIRLIEHRQIPPGILYAKDARANYVTFPEKAVYMGYVLDGAIVGVGALKVRRRSTLLLAAYVLPAFRRRGIYTELLNVRIAMALRPVHAHSTKHSEALLTKAGFTTVKQFKTNKKMILR